MKFGVTVTNAINPNVTAAGQADYVNKATLAVEQCGLDSVWVADRTVYPVDIMDLHPEMFSPHHSKPDSQNLLESVTTLSYAAALTKRVLVGFSVLCLPFRHALLNSKMINTIDVLSNGRVQLGVGTGWMPEEFEAMNVDYKLRGQLTDEHLQLYKAVCAEPNPEFQGEHTSITGTTFFPGPIQKPHPPIWIGGITDAALKRVANYGDYWNAFKVTPQDVVERLNKLGEICSLIDRDPSTIKASTTINMDLTDRQYENGDRVIMTGTNQEVLGDIKRYEDAGLDYMIVSVTASNTEDTINYIYEFADRIAALV
ncbi:MAG: Flavin-dependent oxidoreductase, luciferase family [Chloroflexi bacterium]|jgi:probable F420-dependent oxidoreductase|nr:MAG: Flavin-dependent oxidoreductase, luciferase family [Chloroflexota bacterium]